MFFYFYKTSKPNFNHIKGKRKLILKTFIIQGSTQSIIQCLLETKANATKDIIKLINLGKRLSPNLKWVIQESQLKTQKNKTPLKLHKDQNGEGKPRANHNQQSTPQKSNTQLEPLSIDQLNGKQTVSSSSFNINEANPQNQNQNHHQSTISFNKTSRLTMLIIITRRLNYSTISFSKLYH